MALVSWTNPTYLDPRWDLELNPILDTIKAGLNTTALVPTATKTANYTAVAGDFVMVDATSGAITITAPALVAGAKWGIRLVTASANAVTASTGTGTFDTNGSTTLAFATGYALLDTTWAANAAGTQWVGTSSGKPNSYLGSLFQAVDSDLTTIAGLTATTDSFLQSKSSAWAARTIAQVKTDLGLTGTNSGDQTGGTPALVLGTANTAGASANFIRRDDTILAFDATAPSTLAYGGSAAVGSATVAARRDHVHAMPATTKDTTAQTGVLKGNGTTVSAATSGTDYAPGTSALATGIVKSTTTTGALTIAVAGTDYAAATEPLAVKLAGDLGGTVASPQVVKINGVNMAGLATGILKNTTTTGAPVIATAGTDYVTPSGSGAALTGITASQVSGVATRAPVVTTITVSSNTYTPTTAMDIGIIASPAANFTVVNATGSPADGQKLMLRILSGGTGFTPTFGTAYVSSGVATLPSGVLPASKTVTLGFIWDNTASKWVLLAYDGVGY